MVAKEGTGLVCSSKGFWGRRPEIRKESEREFAQQDTKDAKRWAGWFGGNGCMLQEAIVDRWKWMR
jgi:hypothetical protein